jgi:hypothetical protein
MRGEQLRELCKSDCIVRIVERWNQNQLVRNVKIRVARREALAIEVYGVRHWQSPNPEGAAILILHLPQQRQIFLQRLVIHFGRVFFDDRNDSRRIHETREIVDVAVRVVSGDAILQP